MALYNKDGSVYKLLGPNPAMEEQSTWDDFQLHNMKWDGERYKDTMEVVPMQSDIKIKESFVSELEKTKPQQEAPKKEPKHNITIRETVADQPKENLSATTEPEPQEEVVERKSVVVPDKQREEEERGDEIQKTFIHCLPATIRTRRDDLYGDVTQTIQYGKPTSFEGVILLQSEMLLNVWTDSDSIKEGSVLYPKNNDKRWWRVKKRQNKANGWLLNCLISDYQPSFED